jgi:hypothetical protein
VRVCLAPVYRSRERLMATKLSISIDRSRLSNAGQFEKAFTLMSIDTP